MVECILVQDPLKISEDLVVVFPVGNASLEFLEHLYYHDVCSTVLGTLE